MHACCGGRWLWDSGLLDAGLDGLAFHVCGGILLGGSTWYKILVKLVDNVS